MSRNIFVFGSNTAGRHGKGSALEALKHHGAVYGIGVGLQGNSWAIPTKDGNLKVLPLDVIRCHVEALLDFARHKPDWNFQIVAIGTGLAGYSPSEIGPMFKDAPPNCHMPPEFLS